ncbi:hypothetical protein C8K30_11943 [Promicromonospora sp. AC04]|nr:hypothetical protein C8K30_11943 [Promicromonospora sp. AC04]
MAEHSVTFAVVARAPLRTTSDVFASITDQFGDRTLVFVKSRQDSAELFTDRNHAPTARAQLRGRLR